METSTKGHDLTIPVNNFDLSYDDLGEGTLPIIFLHGFPFDKTMWQVQMEFLESSFRVIACDIRGFGKSKDEKSTLSMDVFADDLIQFMNQLRINQAIVCGLSMGGFITLNALERFPKRFAAVILCDTQCIADTAEVKAKRLQTIEDIKRQGPTSFNEGFIKSVFHDDTLKNKPELVAKLRGVVFSNSQHIITEGLSALAKRSETCSTLSEIITPSLIVCGREDQVTPLVQSEFMNKNIKNSTLKVIELAGHVSNLEAPDEFNQLLRNFLSTLKDIYLEKTTKQELS